MEFSRELNEENTRSAIQRDGEDNWAVEIERSQLTSFARTSSRPLVQDIELAEKYHDEQRGVVYVLAILDKDRAGPRLARQIEKLNHEARVPATRAQQRHNDHDGLEAIKLYREVLNRALKAEVLQRQLGVIAPALLKTNTLSNDSTDLCMTLTDQLRAFDFYVQIDDSDLIEDTMQTALLDAGFAVRAAPLPGRPGLALGRVWM